MSSQFATFAFYGHQKSRQVGKNESVLDMNKRPNLTLYGEINEEELLVNKQKKLQEEKILVLDEKERVQMQQAVTNVIEEKAHLEQHNRFKDLQMIYSQ